jgi:hypothetical protein
MSLRACLFSRKVFNTKAQEVGTIRVEFIPVVPSKRVPLREIKPEPKSRADKELECMESLSDSVSCDEHSCESTEEF